MTIAVPTPSAGGRRTFPGRSVLPGLPALAAALLATLLLAPSPGRAASPCDGCPQGMAAAAPPAAKAAAPAADPLAELARAKKRVVIADFGQGLCRQCKKQGEILEEVKKAYGDRVEVRFVHVRKEAELAERYGIEMIPTLVYLDPSGKARHTDVGVSDFGKVSGRLSSLGVRR